MSYLCFYHHVRLAQETTKSTYYFWLCSIETGMLLYDSGYWSHAIAHIGVAYESADILLRNPSLKHIDLFVASAYALANTYAQLYQTHKREQTIQNTIKRLRHLNAKYAWSDVGRYALAIANTYHHEKIYRLIVKPTLGFDLQDELRYEYPALPDPNVA